MQNRFYVKVGCILALMILLMIPQMFLESLIGERASWRQQAYDSIEQSWPGSQTLGGPVMAVPYQLTWSVSEKIKDGSERVIVREETASEVAYLLPTKLDVQTNLETSIRYRGIYEVPVYTGNVHVQGEFNTQPLLDIVTANKGKRITWGVPELCVLLSDQRGIARSGTLQWQGQPRDFKPGSNIPSAGSGMHTRIPELGTEQAETLPFSFDLDLHGMRSMSVALMAENADIHLAANWAHPSFYGDMLPETREVNESGFKARWRSSAFSGNNAGALESLHRGQAQNLLYRSVGVNMVQPVDVYQQSERSIKYALLFLVLTFGGMVLFELLKKAPIHPVQYTFVGVALLIFYLLLISLSEHISFLWAYVAASLACTGLLTIYFGSILQSRRLGLMLGGGLSVLYGLLYAILQAEDNALMMGSLLLFAVLAALMMTTRNFDWYALTAPLTAKSPRQPVSTDATN